MSVKILTQGGGSAFGICVTGLSETDTVTATKDGKTVNGKWGQKQNPEISVPSGYAQLEYISGSGASGIDTGIHLDFSKDIDIEISFMIESLSSRYCLLGSFGLSESTFNIEINASNAIRIYSDMGEGVDVTGGSVSANTKHILNFFFDASTKKYVVILDGTQIISESFTYSMITEDSQLLFKDYRSKSATVYAKQLSIYSARIKNGEDFCSVYPSKRLSDNVIGMYNIADNMFYTNVGTVDFVSGQEISQYINGHIIKPINKLGTWTIKATNGTNTITKSVLIDIATIELQL